MRGVFEVLLWPLGIRRKTRRNGEHGDDRSDELMPDDSGSWEVDHCHLFSMVTGATLAWWALGRMKVPTAASGSPGGLVAPAAMPKLPFSDFLCLLRAGAVTAVTYLADRPPAGALVIQAALPAAMALAGRAGSGREPSQAAAPVALGAAPACGSAELCTAETLLLPGCHQFLFEELRQQKNLRLECAELATDVDSDINKLSLLIDIGGLLASIAALAYMLRTTGGPGLFTGRHLEEASPSDADRRPAVTFEDVAGMDETKEELKVVITYLRNPSAFYALGARPPRGILLAGPSGTGKTLLARAVAGEAGVPFLYASSAAFVEIFVGQGAQRIRQFYEQARGCAPCIVFLDELDAVGASRQATASGGNQEYAQTLNQLLVELDGIESHSSSASTGPGADPVVVTMAATNRYDCLDEALVRPGRLDRIVMVRLPGFAERVETLQIHARKLHTEALDFQELARRTEGRSGADLANLLNEAALLAARRRAESVRMGHVLEVLRHPRPLQQHAAPVDGLWQRPEVPPVAGANALVQMFAAAAAALSAGGAGGQYASRSPPYAGDAMGVD